MEIGLDEVIGAGARILAGQVRGSNRGKNSLTMFRLYQPTCSNVATVIMVSSGYKRRRSPALGELELQHACAFRVGSPLTAGALVAPALGGAVDECRRGPPVRQRQRCSCSPASMAPAALAGCSRRHGGGGFGAILSGSGPVHHIRLPGNTLQVRGQGRLRVDQGHSVRAVLQSRQERRTQFSAARSRAWAFAYCDFSHQGAAQMLMARAVGPAAFAASAGAVRRCLAHRSFPRRGVRARGNAACRGVPGSNRSSPNRNPSPSPSPRSRKAHLSCAARPSNPGASRQTAPRSTAFNS